ncbi:MAG TPA: glycosyltransferase family 4 protein [Candidatus Enterococcus stercoripullorum]|nr:glycosyltransferase family 4 protein [Candidatus Enterococcus stercoripullorum]
MKVKKIIVYIDSLNASGGMERIVYNLINHWKQKYEIVLITKDNGKCYYGQLKNIRMHSINNPKNLNMNNRLSRVLITAINMFKSIHFLKKMIFKNITEDTIVYTVTPLNVFELFLAGVDPKRIVASEHGSAYGINKVYKMIKKIVYPKVKAISVPNKMDTDYYIKSGYNAVYIPHILYIDNRNEDKNSLENHIILNVGRLTPDKRQELLIRAWEKNDEKNDWELWIAGEGELKEYLEKLVKELNLSDSVKFISASKNIEDIYRKASFFAFSSRFEGFGLVLLEAMSYGIPCLSFDCPSGPRDIIQDNYNGYLIQNNNVEMYIKALKKISTSNTEDRRKMGNQAWSTFLNWDNKEILKKWEELFNE